MPVTPAQPSGHESGEKPARDEFPLRVICGECGRKVKAQAKFEGKTGKCPFCKAPVLMVRPKPGDDAARPSNESSAEPASGVAHLLDAVGLTDYHRESAPADEPYPLRTVCPKCKSKVKAEAKHAGQTGKCPFCNAPVLMPTLESSTDGVLMVAGGSQTNTETLTGLLNMTSGNNAPIGPEGERLEPLPAAKLPAKKAK